METDKPIDVKVLLDSLWFVIREIVSLWNADWKWSAKCLFKFLNLIGCGTTLI